MLRTSIVVAATLFPAASIAAAAIPSPPPLPDSGFPAAAVAEPFARTLVRDVSPKALDAHLTAHAEEIPAVLRTLGSALLTDNASLRASLESYLVSLAQARAGATPAAFSRDDVRLLVSVQLVDPIRFLTDDRFRQRVIPLMPRQLDETIPGALRRAVLIELNGPIGLDFAAAETIAAAWGVVPRSSEARRAGSPAGLRVADDLSGPIEASVYSISSEFVSPAEARQFFTALKKYAPKRTILVLADDALREVVTASGLTFIDTASRPYTPWPRDPFLFARDKSGRVVVVNRPNLQPDREEDANMARALVQNLPADLDDRWKKTQWTVAGVPFHNGHVLLTPQAAWISLHTVEIRTLQILGLQRVPVETFGTAAGISRYLAVATQAAKELEAVYGRPVRFVHPLEPSPQLMQRLGGGAGFDLDSVLTLLPRRDGAMTALVGDPALGAHVAAEADWTDARRTYRINGEVASSQSTPAMKALQSFLDSVASHLEAEGVTVRRLPLINVPASLADDAPRDFLLTWNNVVLEADGDSRRAEGFESRLAVADEFARKTFAAAGYDLTLLPVLARSVVLSGGYRCASNHLRP